MSQIVHISKLNSKGQGIAEENPKIHLWNALPGEEVVYENLKSKKGTKEGVAIEVIKSSKYRIAATETDHYLSCSPLQIVDIEFENEFKLNSMQSKFENEGIVLQDQEIVSNKEEIYGYRNKMEYSFYVDENEQVSISFFKRGSHKGKIPIIGCKLANDSINKVAEQIVEWINSQKISGWSLKTLILRSNSFGECIAGLYSKEKLVFTELPKLNDQFLGLSIYYSDPLSPASKPTELIVQIGQKFLEEKICNKSFRFGLNSFFQVNVQVFESVLNDIEKYIGVNEDIVDMYSGVGSIGISLSDKAKSVELVEVVEEAIQFAETNITENNCTNVIATCTKSEFASNKITRDSVLIVDPPREGLHKDLIKSILEIKPKQIVYLSCNPLTQISDLKLIKEKYEIVFSRFYNFFPRTVHLESLVILKIKNNE